MFCVLSIWKLFTTSLNLQDLKWSYKRSDKLMAPCPVPTFYRWSWWKLHLVITCACTPGCLFSLHWRENIILNCTQGQLTMGAECEWMKNNLSSQCGQIEMHRNTTRSRELRKHLLSKTPHLSKILVMPTVCKSVFDSPPENGLPAWNRLIQLCDRYHKWNLVDVKENHLHRKRHSENSNILRNGRHPSQYLYASPWTNSLLQSGHTEVNTEDIQSGQEYQIEEKKCKGNYNYYTEHSKYH